MKKVIVLHMLLLLAALTAFAPAGDFRLPKPEVYTLPNGLTVIHHQDTVTPIVSFQFVVRGAGKVAETEGKEGLADLTAELLLKGCGTRSAEQVSEEIDTMGAFLQTDSEEETAELNGVCLREHLPALLQIAGDALRTPAVAPEEFDRERSRRKEQLKAIKDEPGQAISLYFYKYYFGAHPLGRSDLGTDKSLAALTAADAKAFFQKHFRPDNVILSVVGDISAEQLKAEVNKVFGNWEKPSAPAAPAVLPPLPAVQGKRLLFVDSPDLDQCFFYLGAPGLAFGDPAEPAANVFNTIFGDRFTSWLNSELRIKRGLTYGAYSNLPSWKTGGLVVVNSDTNGKRIVEMLDIVLDLCRKAKTGGLPAEEVKAARNYIRGQLPLEFESGRKKAETYARLYYENKGWDYYDNFLASVAKTQESEASQVAARLAPDKDFVLVVIGKAAEILPLLGKYGQWETKKVADPGF